MTLATPLDVGIELCFVHCALDCALWQRLSTIKVELELELFSVGQMLPELVASGWCSAFMKILKQIIKVTYILCEKQVSLFQQSLVLALKLYVSLKLTLYRQLSSTL